MKSADDATLSGFKCQLTRGGAGTSGLCGKDGVSWCEMVLGGAHAVSIASEAIHGVR